MSQIKLSLGYRLIYPYISVTLAVTLATSESVRGNPPCIRTGHGQTERCRQGYEKLLFLCGIFSTLALGVLYFGADYIGSVGCEIHAPSYH